MPHSFWHDLRQHLWTLSPKDFEILTAKLLTSLLDEQFIVARAGKQDSGDAQSLAPGTVIQAKRYSSKTLRNIPTVSHDIDRTARNPELDLYILAATTRIDGTLQEEIDRKVTDTGLDVVCIDFPDGDASPLGCLSIKHWDVLKSFQPTMDFASKFESEAAAAAGRAEVGKVVSLTKRQLEGSVESYDRWAKCSRTRLTRLFEDESNQICPIVLSKMIRRNLPMNELRKWWKLRNAVALVQGEEGIGKSWVAASFADEVSHRGTLAFWCSSLEWSSCETIEELVTRALRAHGIFTADQRFLARMTRKVLQRWTRPVLFVLDGVNERGGGRAAGELLRQLSGFRENESSPVGQSLRFLFTSRPLTFHPTHGPELRQQSIVVPVSPFTEGELEEYLSKHRSQLSLGDIPEKVAHLVRIPRHTSLCLRHIRKAPADFSMTPAILMWLDLVDRIEEREDSDVRDDLGWKRAEDALQVLAALAKQMEASNGVTSLRASAIRNSFPSFDSARRVLSDLRYADVGPAISKVSPEISSLAWALYILQEIRGVDGSTIPELADGLSVRIEPAINSDIKSEAIRLAAVLASKDDSLLPSSSAVLATGALVYRWLHLNNIFYDYPTLQFLMLENWDTYVAVVEQCFSEWSVITQNHDLVLPLATEMMKPEPVEEKIVALLKRWLLLCYRPGLSRTGQMVEHEGVSLPVANSERQMRLAGVAMSLISLRPDTVFLETLALAAATQSFSIGDPVGANGEGKVQVKRTPYQFGYILRWGYTETVLPHLYTLADSIPPQASLLHKGYRLLAHYLELDGMRQDFRLSHTPREWSVTTISPETALREQRRMVDVPQDAGYRISQLRTDYLASREDLPPLLKDDVNALYSRGRDFLEKPDCLFRDMGPSIGEDGLLESITWLAVAAPDKAIELLDRARLKMLPFAYDSRYLSSFKAPWHEQLAHEEGKRVLDSWRTALEANSDLDKNIASWQTELSRFAIRCFDTKVLIEWIDYLDIQERNKLSLNLLPAPDLLKSRADQTLARVARQRILALPISEWPKSEWAIVYYSSWGKFDADVVANSCTAISSLEPDHEDQFKLFAILAAAANLQLWEVLKENQELIIRLTWRAVRAFHFHGRVGIQDCAGCFTEELIRQIPDKNFSATLLKVSGYPAWKNLIRDYMDLTINLIDEDTWEPNPPGTVVELTSDGRVSIRCREGSGDSGVRYSRSPAWGYDVGKIELQGYSERTSQKPRDQDKMPKEYKFWRDFKLTDFDANHLLIAFAKCNPSEFNARSRQFFKKLQASHTTTALNLSTFAHAIVRTAVAVDVDLFLELEPLMRGGRVRVNYEGNVPALAVEVFAHANSSHKLQEWLIDYFLDAKSDEEILDIVRAAVYVAAEQLLEQIANRFAAAHLAKERCLAVSILAFLASENAITTLGELSQEDRSRWVKRHATWGKRVALSEKACRRIYREILTTEDDDAALLKLHQFRPALFHSALTWHRRLEKEERFWENATRSRKMLLMAFWNRCESIYSSTEEVYGRRLKEFCRGEKLDSFASPKIAPWWQPFD